MSLVPFTTQIGLSALSQGSGNLRIVLVHTESITERQSSLLRECKDHLCQNLGILVCKDTELELLSPKLRYFVIPTFSSELIKKVRSHFEKPIIYLPRAVIEARSFFRVNLPVRNLASSLTMHHCRVFLVKSCNQTSIKQKIYEMSGTVVTSFNDNNPNVVIADRADDKYCARAFKRNIPVVSKDWVEENFLTAREEESSFFNHDAMSLVKEHRLKPFYGLHFRINVKNFESDIKKLILDNQGHIIYGNENCLTHIVEESDMVTESDNLDQSREHGPKTVDAEFLKLCVDAGYYIGKREYRDLRTMSIVKQEKVSPSIVHDGQRSSPIISRFDSDSIENQTMLPPVSTPRPIKQHQQPDAMNDMILRALSTFETTQTQLASTQMRRLPEPELRIERTFEPSQQLFWNDSTSRRKN